MNDHVLKFVEKYGANGRTLEIGSYNVNGSIRDVVDVTIGIDIRDGQDVDMVLDACDAVEKFGEESFDTVISVDALEHSQEWKCFLQNAIAVLKIGGNLIITAASPKKGRHNYPGDYWRFTTDMWKKIFSEQEILGNLDAAISNGIAVKKLSNIINLDINPIVVE